MAIFLPSTKENVFCCVRRLAYCTVLANVDFCLSRFVMINEPGNKFFELLSVSLNLLIRDVTTHRPRLHV